MLSINTVFRAIPSKDASEGSNREPLFNGFARLLALDNNEVAYMIRLDVPINRIGAPFKVSVRKLVVEVSAGRILANQVFETNLPSSMGLISSEYQAMIERRKDILAEALKDRDVLLNSEHRGRVFRAIADQKNCRVRTVRRLYYQYLWGGQTDLALTPMYANCGSRGVEEKDGGAKRGKKPKVRNYIVPPQSTGKVPLNKVRKALEFGARAFYLPGKFTLHRAYVKTLEARFSKGVDIRGTTGKKVKLREIIVSPDEIPTVRQFRYVCEQIEKKEGKRLLLPGRIRSRKEAREYRGSARDDNPGPGFRFEFDASIYQAKLISRFGRHIEIGSPTIYVIIDGWSSAIVGYAVSLYSASKALASRALFNCFTDKAEVFERLGLDDIYRGDDWPCCHLPTNLTADRAELVSDKAENILGSGVVFEISSAMCPEMKGMVEAKIKDLKHRKSRRLPGEYPKNPMRRENNGSKTAALNIVEFERLIVEAIMSINNEPVPAKYIPQEMIAEGYTDITRIGLYKWGLKNCPGHTRTLPPDEVFFHLMTKGRARVNADGLIFSKQTFNSEMTVNIPMSCKSVEIRYDEHDATKIWFYDGINRAWTPAFNTREDVQRLMATFYELESFLDDVEQLREDVKLEQLYEQNRSDERNDSLINNAQKEARRARRLHGTTTNKGEIKINKQVEAIANDLSDAAKSGARACAEGLANLAVASKASKTNKSRGAKSVAPAAPPPKTPENPAKKATLDLSLSLWS